MKITINCPDSTRIISVVTMGGGDISMWADQQLRNAEDGLEITAEVPKGAKEV